MNLSEEQYKEIANQIDLKDIGFFIKENMSNFKLWSLNEKGEQVIVILTDIQKIGMNKIICGFIAKNAERRVSKND